MGTDCDGKPSNRSSTKMYTIQDRRAVPSASTTAPAPLHPTLAWMDEFAACVRDRDYERGRRMFAKDAVGFGTVAELEVGLENLMQNQWHRVWGNTRGFVYDLETAEHGGEEPVYWCAAKWSSFGKDATGREVERKGRCTIILHRRDGKLLAVHSHYSFTPSGAVTPTPATHQPQQRQQHLQ